MAAESIYPQLLAALQTKGSYLCTEDDKARLQQLMWPEKGAKIPAVEIIAKSALHIAKLAGISIPDDRQFIIVEEYGVGPEHPFSGEKLSVVLTLYQYDGQIDNAIKQVNAITEYQGHGHTCGIHSQNEEHIMALAMNTKAARVMVNQSLNEGAGSPRNGLPYTLSLSCGTWGGNITTENVNARHFVNLTWVSRPIKPREINEEVIFSAYWDRFGKV